MESFRNSSTNQFRHERRERVRLGTLRSGEVVYNRPRSHLHSGVERYLSDALAHISSSEREFMVESVTFDHVIGKQNCVETTSGDEVLYAQRPRRNGLTRFVKNKEKTATATLTVILKKVEDGYMVMTAFYGIKAEPEPWDQNATSESKKYWNTHALIWGSEEVVPGSEISENIST